MIARRGNRRPEVAGRRLGFFYSSKMEMLLYYVRDKAPAAHIWDYLKNRSDRGLCGHQFLDPEDLGEVPRPRSVCRACQELAPKAEAVRWRELAEQTAEELHEWSVDYEDLRVRYNSLLSEYEELWASYEHVQRHCDNQRAEIRRLQSGRSKRTPPPRNKQPKKPSARRQRSGNHVNLNQSSTGKRPRVTLFG